MIYNNDFTLPNEYLEQLSKQGLEGLPDLVRTLVNEAMRIERENYLRAKPYERSRDRQGHANGFKPKTVKTRIGEVPFAVNSPSAPYIVEGTNTINYESVLEEQWRTDSVFFDMDINISGECLVDTSGEQLDLIVKYSGDQLVEIEAEGFQGEYPWSGTDEIAISLPLQNGATTRGEGWQFVLHVD